jgi:hypothetical protein
MLWPTTVSRQLQVFMGANAVLLAGLAYHLHFIERSSLGEEESRIFACTLLALTAVCIGVVDVSIQNAAREYYDNKIVDGELLNSVQYFIAIARSVGHLFPVSYNCFLPQMNLAFSPHLTCASLRSSLKFASQPENCVYFCGSVLCC